MDSDWIGPWFLDLKIYEILFFITFCIFFILFLLFKETVPLAKGTCLLADSKNNKNIRSYYKDTGLSPNIHLERMSFNRKPEMHCRNGEERMLLRVFRLYTWFTAQALTVI